MAKIPFRHTKTLSPDEFKLALKHLFGGYGAQRAFSKCLGIHETTTRRYVNGSRQVPPTVVALMAYMHVRRQAGWTPELEIDHAIESLLEEAKAK